MTNNVSRRDFLKALGAGALTLPYLKAHSEIPSYPIEPSLLLHALVVGKNIDIDGNKRNIGGLIVEHVPYDPVNNRLIRRGESIVFLRHTDDPAISHEVAIEGSTRAFDYSISPQNSFSRDIDGINLGHAVGILSIINNDSGNVAIIENRNQQSISDAILNEQDRRYMGLGFRSAFLEVDGNPHKTTYVSPASVINNINSSNDRHLLPVQSIGLEALLTRDLSASVMPESNSDYELIRGMLFADPWEKFVEIVYESPVNGQTINLKFPVDTAIAVMPQRKDRSFVLVQYSLMPGFNEHGQFVPGEGSIHLDSIARMDFEPNPSQYFFSVKKDDVVLHLIRPGYSDNDFVLKSPDRSGPQWSKYSKDNSVKLGAEELSVEGPFLALGGVQEDNRIHYLGVVNGITPYFIIPREKLERIAFGGDKTLKPRIL